MEEEFHTMGPFDKLKFSLNLLEYFQNIIWELLKTIIYTI